MRSLVSDWASRAAAQSLGRLHTGRLTVEAPDGVRVWGRGEPAATLRIHRPRFISRAVTGGEIGIGESYMDGDWSSPDLVALVRLLIANSSVLTSLPPFAAWAARLRDSIGHRRNDNTRHGSRRNIGQHYDLSNRFFELMLDARLMYSCAIFDGEDESLEAAQERKLDTICDRLSLRPGDRVLEIGSGWGGFALHAALRHGCRVTTTTISARQHEYVSELVERSGDAGRLVTPLFEDYRDLRGRFDKVVSIEMFEAVGLAHYDEFFAACERLLAPSGQMLLQTITVDDWRFDEYRRTPTWIAKYIFPGSELASVREILASVGRVARFGLHHAQEIGPHYAPTLRAWRRRFHARLPEVRALGFDDRFVRMWDLYLAYCEAAFMARHIGNIQLLFARGVPGLPPERPRAVRRPSARSADPVLQES